MSDFTWNKKRVNLGEFVQVGDTVKVRVLEFVPAERKLKLGIKQLCENPWVLLRRDLLLEKSYQQKF